MWYQPYHRGWVANKCQYSHLHVSFHLQFHRNTYNTFKLRLKYAYREVKNGKCKKIQKLTQYVLHCQGSKSHQLMQMSLIYLSIVHIIRTHMVFNYIETEINQSINQS